MEEGIELRGDQVAPPMWIDKLEEAQYSIIKWKIWKAILKTNIFKLSIFRLKPKLDELGSLQARHLLKPSLDESSEEEQIIEMLSGEISKLISSTHRHIQCVRSSLNVGRKMEQLLTQNVVVYLLNDLQDVTSRFRNSQNDYLKALSSREERSNAFFDNQEFSVVELNKPAGDQVEPGHSKVDSFDNFLKPSSNAYLEDEEIDEYFQKPLTTGRLTGQQLLLFEESNTKVIEGREREVSKIVKSILDLHEIFKDLGGMVHEQGTILDRIDYNVECTQSRVSDGLKQLQKAEAYQKKSRKIYCILFEFGLLFFFLMILLYKIMN